MTAHLSISFFKAFDFYRFRKKCARVGLELRKTSASTETMVGAVLSTPT
jgi:hypothetical protein